MLPRLDLTSSVGRAFLGASTQSSINPITQQVLPPSGAQDFPSYSLALQLSQPVFDWKSFRDVSRASSTARAAQLQYDETHLTVAFAVTQAFYEVIRQERVLTVLEQTAARSKDFVARADALFAAGRGTRADTYSARANLANDLIAAEQQRTVVTRRAPRSRRCWARPAARTSRWCRPRRSTRRACPRRSSPTRTRSSPWRAPAARSCSPSASW